MFHAKMQRHEDFFNCMKSASRMSVYRDHKLFVCHGFTRMVKHNNSYILKLEGNAPSLPPRLSKSCSLYLRTKMTKHFPLDCLFNNIDL